MADELASLFHEALALPEGEAAMVMQQMVAADATLALEGQLYEGPAGAMAYRRQLRATSVSLHSVFAAGDQARVLWQVRTATLNLTGVSVVRVRAGQIADCVASMNFAAAAALQTSRERECGICRRAFTLLRSPRVCAECGASVCGRCREGGVCTQCDAAGASASASSPAMDLADRLERSARHSSGSTEEPPSERSIASDSLVQEEAARQLVHPFLDTSTDAEAEEIARAHVARGASFVLQGQEYESVSGLLAYRAFVRRSWTSVFFTVDRTEVVGARVRVHWGVQASSPDGKRKFVFQGISVFGFAGELVVSGINSFPVTRDVSVGAVNATFDKSVKYGVQFARKKEHDACYVCGSKFGILTKKHHCRKCGKVVCHGCSKARQRVRGKLKRVCDVCVHGGGSSSDSDEGAPAGDADSSDEDEEVVNFAAGAGAGAGAGRPAALSLPDMNVAYSELAAARADSPSDEVAEPAQAEAWWARACCCCGRGGGRRGGRGRGRGEPLLLADDVM